MSKKEIHYIFTCFCVFVHLLGKSSEESAFVQSRENSPQSSGDVIMREDAEEMFYNIDLKKYDGVRCPDPEPPENGAIVGEGNQVGSVVYVECQEGYRLDGPEVMACVPVEDGAHWDPLVSRSCIETEKVSEPHSEEDITASRAAAKYQEKHSINIPPSFSPWQQVQRHRNHNVDEPKEETEKVSEPHSEEDITASRAAAKYQEKHSINSPPSFSPWQQVQRHRNHNMDEPKEEPIPESVDLLPSFCQDEPEVGPCRALFKRYYFSKTTMECHTFTYGGCHGNKNNFQTITDCNMACLEHE